MTWVDILGRCALVINGCLFVFAGTAYLQGVSSNRWLVLDSLFHPDLANSCSGSPVPSNPAQGIRLDELASPNEFCWLGLIPFYSVLFFALGFLGILGGLSFGSFEVSTVLLITGLAHAAQAKARLALPPMLYNPGKAWPASRSQYGLAGVDVVLAFVLMAYVALGYEVDTDDDEEDLAKLHRPRSFKGE